MDFKTSLIPRLSLFKKLWENGGVSALSIPELVSKNKSNVIVVDGQNFYGQYVYPKFDWVYGGLTELSEIVCSFVKAFERAGVKLVFVMTDAHLDEGKLSVGGLQWLKDHGKFAQYATDFYDKLKQPKCNILELKKPRDYYHTPFHALGVVLYILRDVLNCEVRLIFPGFRCDEVVNYARENNSLAILAEDSMYLFYKRTPYLLSLRNLDLQSMKTMLYDPKILANIYVIPEEYLYKPLVMIEEESKTEYLEILENFLGEIQNETFFSFKGLFWSLSYLNHAPGSFIYSKFCYVFKVRFSDEKGGTILNKPDLLSGDNASDSSADSVTCDSVHSKRDNASDNASDSVPSKRDIDTSSLVDQTNSVSKDVNTTSASTHLARKLHLIEMECVRFNIGYQYFTPCGPLEKWDFIIKKSEELYRAGKMNGRISILLEGAIFFNDSILEDFYELTPSSLLFIPLRKRLYGILFFEAKEEEFDGIVQEWCISSEGWTRISVTPEQLTSNLVTLHPGLLTLWDEKSNSVDAIANKWELFCGSISSHLDVNLLRRVPPTLVVPTVVLFYLCHVGRNQEARKQTREVKTMETWETDVFIAQAVMLQKESVRNSVSKMVIKEHKARVIKLIAAFTYGCQMVQYYLEVCGNPINRKDMCLFHFFDGKLFHSIYEKALWRRRADIFCDRDVIENFNIMKQIILPESNFSL